MGYNSETPLVLWTILKVPFCPEGSSNPTCLLVSWSGLGHFRTFHALSRGAKYLAHKVLPWEANMHVTDSCAPHANINLVSEPDLSSTCKGLVLRPTFNCAHSGQPQRSASTQMGLLEASGCWATKRQERSPTFDLQRHS